MLQTPVSGLFRCIIVFACAVAAGCSKPAAVAQSTSRLVRVALDQSRPKPYSAASNLPLTEEESRQRLVLNDAEQDDAMAALRSLAKGSESSGLLRPARHGVRWSDVPLAVRFAAEELELAVVRQVGRIDESELTFLLTTIEDRPVELTVLRTSDGQVYEAAATVGRFGRDKELARELVAALDRQLRTLGRKRGFEEVNGDQ